MIRNLFIYKHLRVFLWVSAIKFAKSADFEDKNGVFFEGNREKKKMLFKVVFSVFVVFSLLVFIQFSLSNTCFQHSRKVKFLLVYIVYDIKTIPYHVV